MAFQSWLVGESFIWPNLFLPMEWSNFCGIQLIGGVNFVLSSFIGLTKWILSIILFKAENRATLKQSKANEGMKKNRRSWM